MEFHPLVSEWFSREIGTPTAAQRRGWEAIRDGRHTLVAAPTGSGKTLAAFLTALDDLVREGLAAPLPDEVRVLYVSPLKALSADIHENLARPRRGIRDLAAAAGLRVPRITAAARTGDTPASERAAMLRTPPHILVTTPESLYLLLTAARSREMLRTVRTVIIDEIHAVIGTRRGAHLALSLERLEALQQESRSATEVSGLPWDQAGGAGAAGLESGVPRRIQRIGLSATQKPIDEVARFLVGNEPSRGTCAIVDEGHRRTLDLAVEIPRSPLGAVMANEVWEEYYDRLVELIGAHRTTLVFVNTRRQAERVARHLSDRMGEDAVTAHHGSLSKATRLEAERRLRDGDLKALVATASLELGIDIGHVDLVCQIGSPHRIATLLQRVGRAGHTVAGTPKGRLLPVTRDDLVECAALLLSVRRGDLDRIVQHDAPLDVLAQQITAEASCRTWSEAELCDMARRAWPYRALARADFDAVVAMVSEGFATRRGRRAALVHRDEVHHTLRGRRGTRLLAMTSGGAIPEVADYRVVLDPEETFIGTVNEDFAIESMAGDVFQLGNASWRILQVTAGTVRVTDAQGAPPNIPFWLGEAPARSDELSAAVAEVRREIESKVAGEGEVRGSEFETALAWLKAETGLSGGAAEQIVEYLADGYRALSAMPTQETLVLERFFDESGGMQLVLHAPFGSRVMRAWALALRKRFCRQFNFELQAAATEDALLLSLGPQHSFPLADVFRYLHPATVRDVLVQAMLDAPVFEARWRWNATIALAVPRNRSGRKVPPQIQRMQADDLLAAVFPDAAACLENIPGDRELPDHPLVNQVVRDCLEEAMDLPALTRLLERVHRGELRCVSRDTPEPSSLAHEILNARPYAFLDDAPLEERRAHAVQTRRAGERADDLGALDQSAVARVRDEQRPDPRDADELHDDLLTTGFLLDAEIPDPAAAAALAVAGRATRVRAAGHAIWIAAERLPELLAIHPDAPLDPPIAPPASRAARAWTPEDALASLLRSRLTITGPTTAAALAAAIGTPQSDIDAALLALESDGAVLRGRFSAGEAGSSTGASAKVDIEWCDRALLARIHRYTLNRLRAEIAPVTQADFMRFLFDWQHVAPASRLTGLDGLREILAQLDGLELPARAWERDVLPARMDRYDPALLDTLCLTGEIGWARISSGPTQVVGATPIALFLRENAELWRASSDDAASRGPSLTFDDTVAFESVCGLPSEARPPSSRAKDGASLVLDHLRTHGASFFHDLAVSIGLTHEALRDALADLVAAGLVSSDGFAGLRAIIGDAPSGAAVRRARVDAAGRWFPLAGPAREDGVGPGLPAGSGADPSRLTPERRAEAWARALLRRYGVVFRRVLAREDPPVPWRDLARVYRRLEARGEIRGGRFVSGMSGEQFALPDAVERLRQVRRTAADDATVTISAADPLNLTGLVTPGERIRAVAGTRIVYRNGAPLTEEDHVAREDLRHAAV